MPEAIVEVTDATFKGEVIQSKKPVLVEFWASWCGPCLALKSTLEKIAGDMKDKIKVATVEADKNPKLTDQFHVMGVPTLYIFIDGQIKAHLTNGHSEKELKAKIEETIK